jgi:DNA repair exonuclease SbcCD ATPase subunit
MELTQVETPKKVMSGFATRNASEARIKQEEEELKKLTEENTAAAQATDVAQKATAEGEEDDSNLSAEEKSFKKRYGDLRRHTQKQQTDLQKQIDALQEQLQSSTSKQMRLPTSEEELDKWAREFPDVAKIVETIAIKKAKEQNASIEERFKQLDEMQAQTLREKAEADLMRLHPDFDEIREQSEFHDWVDEQPKWIQDALYANEADAVSAARAIDLYKADKGIGTKKAKKSDDKEAAKEIRGAKRTGFDAADAQGTFRESDVERMSSAEYEKYQEAIVAAIQAGKFIYDKSGSAR